MPDLLPVAVVLAGGASSRFAPLENKSLFLFGGVSLLGYEVAELTSV
ncbi:MAG: Nucleotidyl transferase, partial [Dehalococcoidia bacterium]|nr:Nucleotidyl transferase [Dehalococcoidia bacterium]